MHTKWMQSLQWNLQVALSGSEVLKVEVYDHETVGSNRYTTSNLILTLNKSLQNGINREHAEQSY